MSSENAKPDQIQASVAAALSRLRGDLNTAAVPSSEEAPRGEMGRPANDLRADPFFKSIQSPPPVATPARAPIPMTPFTRMQAPQEPTPSTDPESSTNEPLVAAMNEPEVVPTPMPDPTLSAPIAMPEPTPAPKPAHTPVVERQGAGALSRILQRPEANEATPNEPMQRDLLAGLPPPPISEPLNTDTDSSAVRRRRRNRRILAAALVIVVLAIGAWLWSGGDGNQDVPVITAETTPEKVAPVEEGGLQVENQNVQILNGDSAQPQEETVMPAPEQPVAPPEATVQQAPVVVETPATDGNAAQPGTEAPVAEAPVVEAPAAPEVPLTAIPLPEQGESATNTATPPEAEAPAIAAAPETPAAAPAPAATPTEQPATQATSEPAAAAEPAATQQASIAPSTTGNARIQLAAVKTEAAAQAEWAKLQKAHPALLGALTLTVQRVDKGADGVFYRLQAGPLADKNAAKQLCASLKQQNQDCIVAK